MSFAEVKTATALREAGRCIYCGAEDDLSDEHVIPFALGGNLYVPNASCPKCRDLTSKFELRVLRGFMYRARIAGNFPTRRPRKRPDHVGVTLLDGETPRDAVLPQRSAATLLQLPMFEPPRVLVGKPRIQGINHCGMEMIHFGADIDKAVKDNQGTGFRQQDNIEWEDFVRMLAKIGYSYITGAFGLVPLEQILVLPLIQGQTNDAGNWIGSRQYETESERRGALHSVSHIVYESDGGPVQRFLVARIKLFASSGATGYEVVVRQA